ncbi:MAG: hypothetical protein ACT4PY_12890 [Armatimonadota bacterium]
MIVIGIILVAVGSLHLALLPFIRVRATIPAIAQALNDAEERIRSADQAVNAAAVALDRVARFRRRMDGAPAILRSAIAELVERGHAVVGPRGNPYKARIRVAGEVAKPGDVRVLEEVLVEEEIRRHIGRTVEALSLSLEAALEPLRLLKPAPARTEEAYRAAQVVSHDIMALNHVLREAFAADPNFWARWQGQDSRFGAVSARAKEAVRRVEDGLRALDGTLVAASASWKRQQQEDLALSAALRARQAEVNERLTEFPRRLGWIPGDLEDTLRLYPIVAGALAVTALFSLWHILRTRREGAGERSVLFPVAAPLIATIHAAVAVITDRGLHAASPGNPGPTTPYEAAYAALILVGAALLVVVMRRLMTAPRMPSAAPAAGARTGI